MCNANFYESGAFGKFNSKIDPLGAYIGTGNKDKLDPVNMNNEIPIPKPPPPPQDLKMPVGMEARRRARNPTSLLTGPSGVTANSLTTGGATLLGG